MIPRRAVTALIAALLAAVLTQGCAPRPEQTLISDYFAACRLRDLTTLARIGTVVFEPRERGIITAFTIRRVSPVREERGSEVKDVAIDAPVQLPDGSAVPKSLVVRLQRRGAQDSTLYGGWVVTAVTDSPQSAAPPQS
jgi:hypothetical protein